MLEILFFIQERVSYFLYLYKAINTFKKKTFLFGNASLFVTISEVIQRKSI